MRQQPAKRRVFTAEYNPPEGRGRTPKRWGAGTFAVRPDSGYMYACVDILTMTMTMTMTDNDNKDKDMDIDILPSSSCGYIYVCVCIYVRM